MLQQQEPLVEWKDVVPIIQEVEGIRFLRKMLELEVKEGAFAELSLVQFIPLLVCK